MHLHPIVQRKTLLCLVATAALAGGLVGAARADELQDLKAQLDALTKKVAELEGRQPAQPPANVVSGGATPGSFRLPGSATSVSVGGYVKLDAIYSDKSAGVNSTADQEYEAGAVPVGPNAGANERNQVKLHARQSRLFVKTATPSAYGDLGTYLEIDLFGASGNESVSNSNNLRLRHAYGTLGPVLAGQTWTTLSDPAAYPETLDFGGPAGQIFARQAQIRWTQAFKGGQWSVALENPETVAALPDGTAFRADDDRVPDIAANVHFDSARGKYSIAGMLRQLRVDSGADPASRDGKWGGVLGVNGVVPFADKDDLRFSAYFGNAIGRYSVGFFSDAVLDSNARLALPDQWLAFAAYRHFWRDNLRSSLVLSGLRSNNPEGTAEGVNRSAESLHANLIWSPIAQTNFGIEVLAARREVQSGQSGRLNRVQASAQYTF
jgi:hypothetical protein